MRLRILLLVLMLLLPIKAQAAITWDFSAIAGTIQTVVTNVKTQIDTVKATVLEWKFVQRLGSYISTVADFFQSVRYEYIKIVDSYNKWRKDILEFKNRLADYYYSAVDVYKAALDTAEHISEIAARVQKYFEESKAIIQYIGDTITKCSDNAKELVSFRKHFDEQKREYEANIAEYRAAQASLRQEYDEIAAVSEKTADQISRMHYLREQIDIKETQIANFSSMIDNIDIQINNFIASQKSLVYECVYAVRSIRGRIDRLACYINNSEIKGFESRINQIGDSINNWANQTSALESATTDLANDFTSGCGNIAAVMDDCITCEHTPSNQAACNKCNTCKPAEGETYVYVPLSDDNPNCENKIKEILGRPGFESCQDYKKTCETQIAAGNPNSETCEISCSPLCNYSMGASSQVCCNIFRSKCNSNNKSGYCNELGKYCGAGLSYNYSISTSSSTAFAFSFTKENDKIVVNGDVKSGEDGYGNLILPDNLAVCCQIDYSDVQKTAKKDEDKEKQEALENQGTEELYTCLSRYIKAIYTPAGTVIPNEDKTFFQCLRREIGISEQNFEEKSKVIPSDNLAAANFLEEAYAEYLAGAYLDSLRAYHDSIEYVEKEIRSVANSSYKDIGSNWTAVVNMNLQVNNRINEISKIWSREHLISAANRARNSKISTKEKNDAQ